MSGACDEVRVLCKGSAFSLAACFYGILPMILQPMSRWGVVAIMDAGWDGLAMMAWMRVTQKRTHRSGATAWVLSVLSDIVHPARTDPWMVPVQHARFRFGVSNSGRRNPISSGWVGIKICETIF
jgi:hypothetical protein